MSALNTAPRFAEPDDDTPDFSGFVDRFVAKDTEFVLQIDAVPAPIEIASIEFDVTGYGEDLVFGSQAKIITPYSDPAGSFWIPMDKEARQTPNEKVLGASLDVWITAHRRDVYAWACEQVEG